jgi:hypothetical protein
VLGGGFAVSQVRDFERVGRAAVRVRAHRGHVERWVVGRVVERVAAFFGWTLGRLLTAACRARRPGLLAVGGRARRTGVPEHGRDIERVDEVELPFECVRAAGALSVVLCRRARVAAVSRCRGWS